MSNDPDRFANKTASWLKWAIAFTLCVIAALIFAPRSRRTTSITSEPYHSTSGPTAVNSIALRRPAEFLNITDRERRSIALFTEAGKVIESPRCMNCHPAGNRPTQTDVMSPHQPLVVRGDAKGQGPPGGLHCNTCHHDENYDVAGVPGNSKWALAPISMAWQGKTLGQICVQLKDRNRNGGKTLAQLVTHFGTDELVGWGWHPGGGRMPAPGSQSEMGDLIRAWVDTGASCPAP